VPSSFPSMESLESLLSRPESKTLEFKRDLSSPEKVLRTLVAFANGAGGILIVGVEDGSKSVVGVANPTKEEERMASLISDSIHPPLVPEICLLPWRRISVIAVEVFPSGLRPHYLKSKGTPGGVYLRVGSTNRSADPAQVQELQRSVLGQTFDELPMSELDSEAIDFRAASESFAPKRKLAKSDLKTLHLVVRHQRKETPTVGGMLLFGKNRREFFPEATVKAAHFAGNDRTQIIDSEEIDCALPAAVEEVLRFARKNLAKATKISGSRHSENWAFPLVALREAIANSLVHADYALKGSPVRFAIFGNRIEIENPGLLLPGLTTTDMQRGVSKLRNRVIGRVFHELGLIEQWGSGIQRMNQECRNSGFPLPLLEELGQSFRVTFSRAKSEPSEIDAKDSRILQIVKETPGLTTARIAALIALTPRATRDRLSKLVEAGSLSVVATGPRDPKRAFYPSQL
ncbi:MAG: ATP-binding protein, partial [Terrimicrobiaceae bacterium]